MALKPGQRKCIETLDKPIVVAAGAGSGKTFTLTQRIVRALESGYIDDIGQLCAITFTNKAAAELKSRVKAELRACGLVEQSLKADDAWISTIHGMCARILRAHALELGLDPSFAMGDEPTLRRLRDESVDEVLSQAQALATGARDAEAGGGGIPAVGEGGITADDVAALFGEYNARSSNYGGSSVEGMLDRLVGLAASSKRGADAFVLQAGEPNVSGLVQAAVDAYADLIAAAEQLKPSNSRDAWLAPAHEALEAAQTALTAGEVGDCGQALRLLAGFAVSKRFGSKDFKARVDECTLARDACIMEVRLAAADAHLRTLVALTRQVLARFAGKKRRVGVLDNDDLLVLASQAMEEHPDIAAAYAGCFKLVMVDEFQDTDQMQVDMIKRIAGPGACRLCTVGDAQQSIYRFRGADVSVYRRHLESVRAVDPDGIIQLPDNFRSHPDVLKLVDRVFERPEMFGGEFMSLAPGRDESRVTRPFPEGIPRIRVQQVTKAHTKGVSAEEVVREQARQVASAFAGLKAAGMAAGDMAVLLGRMANAGVYAQALRDAGLPCVVSGGSVFRESSEAAAVLELARVAVNAADTEALRNVLAGPAFRVPDADLLALATAIDPCDGLPRRRSLDAGLRALQRALARVRQEERASASAAASRAAESTAVFGDAAHAAAAASADGAGDAPAVPAPEMPADAPGAGDAAHAAAAGTGDAALAAAAASADGTGDAPAVPAPEMPADAPGAGVADLAFARACSPQMRCAARVLGRLQRGVGREALSRLLMRAVVDAGWISRLQAAGPEGLASAANVYKAIRVVEGVEALRPAGPVGVLRAFEETLELAKEAPGALSTEGGDFVRIMTVHASKGLEFPVAAVAEFKDVRAESSSLLALSDGDAVYLSLDLGLSVSRIGGAVKAAKPGDTVYPLLLEGCADEEDLKRAVRAADGAVALRAALSSLGTMGDEEEAKRLLYVALTRAKEALVVAVSGTRTKDNPNGVPKNCLGELVRALARDDAGFEPGTSAREFGGSGMALVEHTALERDDDAADVPDPFVPAGGGQVFPLRAAFAQPQPADCLPAGAAASHVPSSSTVQSVLPQDNRVPEGVAAPEGSSGREFMVPADEAEPFVARVPYVEAHAGVFSYSSVAAASREGGFLRDLASQFAVACDGTARESGAEHADAGGISPLHVRGGYLGAAEDDDGAWAFLGSDCRDADKATDFGTAFHRLAQYAADCKVPGAELSMPPAPRIRATMRACGLGEQQAGRLDDALARWFGSDEAREMGTWPNLQAEVPFFVALPAAEGGGPIFLEGEIDLLAASADGHRARVVDYKTGGRAGESDAALREKHVLQASCYALALLRQGMREVEASFVRVEQPRAGDPEQPQRVRYRFTAADSSTLERSIAQAYQLAR